MGVLKKTLQLPKGFAKAIIKVIKGTRDLQCGEYITLETFSVKKCHEYSNVTNIYVFNSV